MMIKEELIAWYDKKLSKERTDYHERINRGIDRLNLSSERTVLDLGCGCGVNSLYMARQGARVTAVDFSPARIEFAKEKMKSRNIEYILDDVFDFRAANDERFDVVSLVSIIDKIDPSLLPKLMPTIMAHSHSQTVIYLTYATEFFVDERIKRELEGRSILDNKIPLPLILTMFNNIGFVPAGIEPFGMLSAMENWEIIFITKMHMDAVWHEVYNPATPNGAAPDGAQDKEDS